MCSNCRDYEGPYDESELESNAEPTPQDRHMFDMWVSLGLIALMTLLLLTPKALRWIYFFWR